MTFSHRNITTLVVAILFQLVATSGFARDAGSHRDTLEVSGKSTPQLSRYCTYWIDETDQGNLNSALSAYADGSFNHWEAGTALNLGLNAHPLWYHLTVKNTSPIHLEYWWSIYSHADSVVIYKRTEEGFILHDALSFSQPIYERKLNVRFLTSSFLLEPGSVNELFIKVINRHETQNAYLDFTVPVDNLLWETGFTWSVAFFSGVITLAILLSLMVAIVLRNGSFAAFSGSTALILIVILNQEFLITLFPSERLFSTLIRFPSLGLAIMSSALEFFVIVFILQPPPSRTKFFKALKIINQIGVIYGAIISVIHFIFINQLHTGMPAYRFFWYLSIGIALLLMGVQFAAIVAASRNKRQLPAFISVAILTFFFNPTGYYLNYSGLVHYYEITYPNYFYWVLILEYILLGSVLAWRFRRITEENFTLLEERTKEQTMLLDKEIEIQENERKQIARDLHDDLGASISAIKLIITNSYSSDKSLVKMITRASSDLRIFTNQYGQELLNERGLFESLEAKVSDLNELGKTEFQFFGSRKDSEIDKALGISLYRMASELLNNILKHAEATTATLQLIVYDDRVVLMAEDNGKGFDLNQLHRGIGLENIKTRAGRFGGEVHITSNEQTGTTSIINIPLNT